jgi:hypothetical protein
VGFGYDPARSPPADPVGMLVTPLIVTVGVTGDTVTELTTGEIVRLTLLIA